MTQVAPIPLGQTLITFKAKQALQPQEVLAALYHHARGGTNVSSHRSADGTPFQIVTESDQQTTTVFLGTETDCSDAGLVESWVCNCGCRSCGG